MKSKMKKMTLNQLKDQNIGEAGTSARDKYEFDLEKELIGAMIKKVKKKEANSKRKR